MDGLDQDIVKITVNTKDKSTTIYVTENEKLVAGIELSGRITKKSLASALKLICNALEEK